jgi:hypothetical protein
MQQIARNLSDGMSGFLGGMRSCSWIVTRSMPMLFGASCGTPA